MCTCITVIHSSVQKAKKEYRDDGWDDIRQWIESGMRVEPKHRNNKLTFAEKRQLVLLKNNKPHKIQKGQEYERQHNVMDGDVYVWRTKKLFYELMCRYDLFSEC